MAFCRRVLRSLRVMRPAPSATVWRGGCLLRYYAACLNPKLPMLDALRLAVQECGYDDLLVDGTVAVWATNLSSNGVHVLGDLQEPSAHDVLKKSGVKNLKLCQNVLQQAFPMEEPKVDKAAVDAQTEYWQNVEDELGRMRAAGEWKEMVPRLLELLQRAEEEAGLHPFYVPQLYQELAQCYYHTEQFLKCMEANSTALSIYMEGQNTQKWMEAMFFQGLVHIAINQDQNAAVAFEMILKWADGEAQSDSPVLATAARDLKLSVRAELGTLKVKMGELKEAEALLSANLVDASKCNAYEQTIRTLQGLVECFDAMKDYKRCLSVAERAVAWCGKHNKPEEAAQMAPTVAHYRELLQKAEAQ